MVDLIQWLFFSLNGNYSLKKIRHILNCSLKVRRNKETFAWFTIILSTKH